MLALLAGLKSLCGNSRARDNFEAQRLARASMMRSKASRWWIRAPTAAGRLSIGVSNSTPWWPAQIPPPLSTAL